MSKLKSAASNTPAIQQKRKANTNRYAILTRTLQENCNSTMSILVIFGQASLTSTSKTEPNTRERFLPGMSSHNVTLTLQVANFAHKQFSAGMN